ncbi:MAG: phosphoglucosamine mutase [Methanomassiliicoccales archaeon]|nr:phosphoglucosamine mutase [Methanomassiliicoccales archaeon]NYT14449.1 phosphoglucosamine mutase [Methanomassiliicoccales archaeon]
MNGRLFGTNGVRGVVNEDMNICLAMELGQAIGEFMGGEVAIGTDTRTSAQMIKSAVSSGLMAAGADVVDLGVVPTPALQYFIKTSEAHGGVMITASHNPPEFNGIKCVDADGTEMPREKEELIEALYFEKRFHHRGWREVGSIIPSADAIRQYSNAILSLVDVDAIRKANLSVVLDCANGAGSLCAPNLLEAMGVRAVTLNCNPQGTFPGHPSEPTPDHLGDLISLVRETDADLGIAQDGDADRAIFVDEKGNYLYGDKSLSILAMTAVREKGGTVVTPVSSSSCVEDVVRREGGEVVYTKVGAPIVARKMIEIGATFGGEENGGLIFPEHQYCRDAAMTTAKMLEILSTQGTLSELVKQVPVYHLDKRKVKCPNELKQQVLGTIASMESDRRVDQTDGLKIYFDDGWTLVRLSGTEPIVRIYSEGITRESARDRGENYERLVRDLISKGL